MAPNGYDKASGYLMWRCPYGKDHGSKCKNSCTDSRYERVVKTRPEWDIRLYTEVPHGTDAYKKIYNQRTATERINNRILNDYGLHGMFIHTKEHYSFMTAMIGIAFIWMRVTNSCLRPLKTEFPVRKFSQGLLSRQA